MSAIPFTVLTAASWAVTGVAILLTAGRFWIRCTIIRRLSWDDAAHLLGLLLLIAQVSIVTGAASMVYEISYNNYDLERDGRFEAEHRLFVHLNVAGILISWCCLYAIKISFLMLYHRIFQISDRFIQAWWTVLAIVFLSFWVLVAGCLTECGSPSDIGDYKKCNSPSMVRRQTILVIYTCAVNVVSDLAIMALPLAMLRGLQMRTSAKVGLAGVFGCAFITIAFDILRAFETDLKGGVKGSTALWTNLESAVAVIVCCLPTLSALFSPKNPRSGGRGRDPYMHRSLLITDSAKNCMGAENSAKSSKDSCTSTTGDLEKDILSPSVPTEESAGNSAESRQVFII